MSRTDTAGRGRLWPPAVRIFSPLATLRGRIIAGFALLIIITAVGAAGSAWQTRAHHSDLTDMHNAADTVNFLQQADGAATFALALLELYVSTGDESTIPAIRSSLATAAQKLSAAQALPQLHSSEDHSALFRQFLTVNSMSSALAEQVIGERGLAVINVRDDGDIADRSHGGEKTSGQMIASACQKSNIAGNSAKCLTLVFYECYAENRLIF